MKKKTNKQERAYMGRVAELGCVICGGIPEIHHNTKNRGYGAKSSNYDIIPLCPLHHRGIDPKAETAEDFRKATQSGFHSAGDKTWQAKYGDQDDLVRKVRLKIYRPISRSSDPEAEAERIGKTVEELNNYILNNTE